MKDHKEMGRFSIEFVAANYRDIVLQGPGEPVLDNVKHVVVSGVVDQRSRTARLAAARRGSVEIAGQRRNDGSLC